MRTILTLAALSLMAAPLAAQQGFLGVQISPPESGGGARIVQVVPDSPAAAVGLQANDVILMVDGKKVDGTETLIGLISGHRPGDQVRLSLRRNGEVVNQVVFLGRREGQEAGEHEGGQRGERGEEAEARLKELLRDREKEFAGVRERLRRIQKELQGGKEDMEAMLEREGGHALKFRFESKDGAGDLEDLFENLHVDFGGMDLKDAKVHLVYPENTPREKREKLIQEAKAKFGRDTRVEFEGDKMMMSLSLGKASGGDRAEIHVRKSLKELLDEDEDEEGPEHAESAPHGGGNWHESLESALAASRKGGKPVLVDFYADWCGPCRALAREVLHNGQYADLVNGFEAVRINVDNHRELAGKYGVNGIPDVRILDGQGKELARFIGYGGAKDYEGKLRGALDAASGNARARKPASQADEEQAPQAAAPRAGGWHENLESALAAARKSGKPVLVDFYADWCGPCRALGREVLDNQDSADLVGRFETVRVNVDQHGDLAKKFGVEGIPDVRILDPSGKQLDRFVGYGGQKDYRGKLSTFLAGYQAPASSSVAPRPQQRGAAAAKAAQGASLQRARIAAQQARRAELQNRIQAVEAEIGRLQAELKKLQKDG
ncbi:MAG: thioredoxin family protein [Planctomycetota bacterium]